MTLPEEPEDVGDCYLLVGYQFDEKYNIFGFACTMDDPLDENKWSWHLQLDDGDILEFNDSLPCEEVLLIRRVRDGLDKCIPDQYKEALRKGD